MEVACGSGHGRTGTALTCLAVRDGVLASEAASAGRGGCQWQRDHLPDAIRELVLDNQRVRNDICWSVFDC